MMVIWNSLSTFHVDFVQNDRNESNYFSVIVNRMHIYNRTLFQSRDL